MSELEIPERAWKAAEYSQDILKAAAPIIVAAYLNHLADEELRDRASRLDPQ